MHASWWLRLEASDGTVGWGEAAPFEPYDGVPLDRAIAALSGGGGRRRPRRARRRRSPGSTSRRARRGAPRRAQARRPAGELHAVRRAAGGWPSARGAARRLRLLQGQGRAARGRGTGGGGARGGRPWPALRVDANRAWSVDDAVARIRELEQYDLEFVSSRAARSTSCARCADACRRRSRRTSRSAPARGAPGRGDRGLRRGQREAGQRRRLQARPRGAAAGAGEGLGAFLSSTLDGPWASPPRCSWQPRRTCSWPADSRRSSCSTRRWRALPAPVNGTLRVPSGPGWDVERPGRDRGRPFPA